MKSTLKTVCHWMLVFVWAGIIFKMSSMPNLSPPADTFNYFDFLLKKSAHFVEYSVLAILLIAAIRNGGASFRKAVMISIAIAVLYAASDEIHQKFVVGRSGRPMDVFIDSAGVLAGMVIFNARLKFEKLRKIRKEIINLADLFPFADMAKREERSKI